MLIQFMRKTEIIISVKEFRLAHIPSVMFLWKVSHTFMETIPSQNVFFYYISSNKWPNKSLCDCIIPNFKAHF